MWKPTRDDDETLETLKDIKVLLGLIARQNKTLVNYVQKKQEQENRNIRT